jgi:hypothetical protein
MKKYIVISLTLGGLGNKIFKYGDVVSENNFPKGNAEKLVQQEFLKEVVEETADAPAAAEITVVVPPVTAPDYDSVTKADLMKTLTDKAIQFSPDAKKGELYDLAYPAPSGLTEEEIIAANKLAAEANATGTI